MTHEIRRTLAIGLAVGALTSAALLVVGRARAEGAPAATPQAHTECIAVSLWEMRGKDLNDGAPPVKTVRVPPGWSVVGGTTATGTMNSPAMVICR